MAVGLCIIVVRAHQQEDIFYVFVSSSRWILCISCVWPLDVLVISVGYVYHTRYLLNMCFIAVGGVCDV